ncbi:recombinase family protein [Lysinibacillus parviboronicapiens]|uniref:recombinase family protein n=1 Tax=Lysinibacillus parviboronicapiens TaxID=436516 RepID=UPI000AD614BD|nr:recombinase family protein [Lysinibacillus parviboronicapiens]
MRTAIYVRVSTQEQAEEGYSIKAQLERLQAYAHPKIGKSLKPILTTDRVLRI